MEIVFISLGLIVVIMVVGLLWYLHPSCKHQWEILSETQTKSQFEKYAEMTGKVPNPRYSVQLEEGTKKKLIQIVTCKKCGKLKKMVEEI